MDWTRDRFPDGRVVYTSPAHRFQTDALRLAAFAMPADSERVCDLGTGCGVIPLRWHDRGHRGLCLALDIAPGAVARSSASYSLSLAVITSPIATLLYVVVVESSIPTSY